LFAAGHMENAAHTMKSEEVCVNFARLIWEACGPNLSQYSNEVLIVKPEKEGRV
jgi:hypothetical protein